MGGIFRRSVEERRLLQLTDNTTNFELLLKKHVKSWLSAVTDRETGLRLSLSDYQAMLDEIEVCFDENIQSFMDRIIVDEESYVTVFNLLESNINFLGNAVTCGTIKRDAMLNMYRLDLPDIDLNTFPSLLISFNILLHVLLRFFNKIHTYENAVELLSDDFSSPHSDKENNSSSITDWSPSHSQSAKRLSAGELRILKTASSKRNSDLRCYVLSKNLLAAAASSLRVEWASNEKVGFVRRRIRDAIELLDIIRSEVNISLGSHMTNNQQHSAYCLLVHLLGLIRIRFVNHFEDMLSFLTCQETESGIFSDQIGNSIRHLEELLSRGYLRFVRFDEDTNSSKIVALQINDNEDVRYIIGVLLSVLNCINSVAKNELPPARLSVLLKESYVEVVKSKLRPNWSSLGYCFTEDLSVSFEEIMGELTARK